MNKNNIVIMTRGDSLDFGIYPVSISEYVDYCLTGDDTIYFGLMDPGQYFEDALIRKKYTAEDCPCVGDLIISLTPEETLDLYPGKYFYAIKLHQNHPELDPITGETTSVVDRVVTLVNKTKFIIND